MLNCAPGKAGEDCLVAESKTTPNESTRTYVSLLLFMHLFCVAIVLSGNHFPSRLQAKLAKTLSIYTKTLHLDPGFASFELTDGERGLMQLHQWQIVELGDSEQTDGDVVLQIPHSKNAAWINGGFQKTRGEMYTRLAAFYASTENTDDEVCAAMARDLAAHHFASDHTATETAEPGTKRLLIRCVSLLDDEAIYEVDAWQTKAGNLQILKRMEARRTAPSN